MSPAYVSWVRYHVSTEAFDRTLRGSWSVYSKNCWIPNPDCRQTSSMNSRKTMRAMQGDHRMNEIEKLRAAHDVEMHFGPGVDAVAVLQLLLPDSDLGPNGECPQCGGVDCRCHQDVF